MKRAKTEQKNEKSENDTASSSLFCAVEKVKIYGFPLTPSFSNLISAAAKKAGLSRANFVRLAVVKALREAGFAVDDANAVSYQGKQSLPKSEVLARAAGARAVRDSKTPGTPENARRMALLAAGYAEDAVAAYLYAKARAEKTAGRALTPAEDQEFITSAAARAAEASNPWGAGPPNL